MFLPKHHLCDHQGYMSVTRVRLVMETKPSVRQKWNISTFCELYWWMQVSSKCYVNLKMWLNKICALQVNFFVSYFCPSFSLSILVILLLSHLLSVGFFVFSFAHQLPHVTNHWLEFDNSISVRLGEYKLSLMRS